MKFLIIRKRRRGRDETNHPLASNKLISQLFILTQSRDSGALNILEGPVHAWPSEAFIMTSPDAAWTHGSLFGSGILRGPGSNERRGRD